MSTAHHVTLETFEQACRLQTHGERVNPLKAYIDFYVEEATQIFNAAADVLKQESEATQDATLLAPLNNLQAAGILGADSKDKVNTVIGALITEWSGGTLDLNQLSAQKHYLIYRKLDKSVEQSMQTAWAQVEACQDTLANGTRKEAVKVASYMLESLYKSRNAHSLLNAPIPLGKKLPFKMHKSHALH